MKYLLSILVLIVSIQCFGQPYTFGFPSQLPGNNTSQIIINQGTVGGINGFTWIKSFADTTAINSLTLPYTKNQPGIVSMVGGSELWMRNQSAKSWILMTGAAIDNNQWFGTDAFATYKNGTLTTGTQNSAFGKNVLQFNTSGIGNSGFGFNALANNNGDYNTATGYIALRQNTTGVNNTATGAQSLLANTTGYRNTATGYNAQTLATIGHDNTSSGANSLPALTTGVSNTVSGSNSMLALTIGSLNTAIGDSVFFANVAGIGNVGIGYKVGSNTGGNYNTFIGQEAGNNASQMATPINSIAIGYQSFTTASNQIVIGNSSHTDLRLYGLSAGQGNATVRYDTLTKQTYYGSPADVSANNGLTDSSGRIVMGGVFYKPTTINTQGYGLTLRSTNTAATDTLFSLLSSGANTSSTLTTVGQSITLSNTGTASNNYGLISAISGASANYAIRGIASGGALSIGGWFTGNTNGVYITSGASASVPLYAQSFFNGSNTSPVAEFVGQLSNASSSDHIMLKLTRNGGTPGVSDHPSGSIGYYGTTTDGTSQITNTLTSKLSTSTTASYTSRFTISGVNNGGSLDSLFSVEGTGQLGAHKYGVGGFTSGTPTYYLATTATGNIMEVVAGAAATPFLPLTGTGTATGNIIGDLDGNTLAIQEGGNSFLSIDPTAGNEVAVLQAYNTTGGANIASYFANTSNTNVETEITANFNGGSKFADIDLIADATSGRMTLSADVLFIRSTLAGSVNGYVWMLVNNATGEGAWVISPGGGGGSVNSVNVSGGTTGLSFSGGPITTSGTITMAGTLGVANGGTNIASYAIGDLIYASASTTLSKLADVAAGSYLRSGGVTTAPVWSTLILPNAITANQIVYGVSTNTYGSGASLTFDGNILTQTSGVTTGTTTSSAFVGTYNGVTSGTGMYLAGSGSTSGNYLQIISTGTAKAANNEALDIVVSGANATNGITVTGGRIAVTNTNATSGTNIAFATRASGATTLNLDLDMGIAGTAGGHMRINGLISGGVILQTANAAGTWTMTLPTDDGANNFDYLITDGNGVTSWAQGFNKTVQTLTDAVSITWNVNSGGNAQVTLGAAGRTLAITNAVAGYTYTIRIIQDGTGSRTITTWPTGIKWPNNGTAPTLTTTAGHFDMVTFYYDGTNFYGNYNFDYQ